MQLSFGEVSADNFRAHYVDIQPSSTSAGLESGETNPSQRDVCFALGKILFELFCGSGASSSLFNQDSNDNADVQRGDSPPAMENMSHRTIENDEDYAGDSEDMYHEFPLLKKAFLACDSEEQTNTKSLKAKESLQSHAMPPSIVHLVCDLLDAEKGNPFVPDTAILSLSKARRDLLQMKSFPERLLLDSDSYSCPKKTLEKTALFNNQHSNNANADNEPLYGREKELNILLEMAERVSQHVPSVKRKGFLCKAAFISGHSGSGKSSLTKRLVSHWKNTGTNDDYSVIYCKFDRQVAPLSKCCPHVQLQVVVFGFAYFHTVVVRI